MYWTGFPTYSTKYPFSPRGDPRLCGVPGLAPRSLCRGKCPQKFWMFEGSLSIFGLWRHYAQTPPLWFNSCDPSESHTSPASKSGSINWCPYANESSMRSRQAPVSWTQTHLIIKVGVYISIFWAVFCVSRSRLSGVVVVVMSEASRLLDSEGWLWISRGELGVRGRQDLSPWRVGCRAALEDLHVRTAGKSEVEC